MIPFSIKSLRHHHVFAILSGIVVLLVFWFFGNSTRGYIDSPSALYWWVFQWFNEGSDTEHGIIVLGISIALFWWNHKQFSRSSSAPRAGLGTLLLAGGFFLNLLGYHTQQTRIGVVGFLVCVVGIAFIAGGNRAGRAAMFPAFLMLFSLPMEFLTDQFSFKMRMSIIAITHQLANTLGFDVIRNGAQLYASDMSYTYEVAGACSGVNSLVALVVLSVALSYYVFRTTSRRLIISLLAIPFTYIGNVVRIFSIILAAEWFGQEAGVVVHDWFGFLIFVIVLGLQMATIVFIEKKFPEKKAMGNESADPAEVTAAHDSSAGARPSETPASVGGLSPRATVLFTIAVLGLGILNAVTAYTLDNMSMRLVTGVKLAENGSDPVELPTMLDFEWMGREAQVTSAERDILPPDTGFSRKIYTDIRGRNVYFSIVLSGRDRSSIHRPELCLAGQGWAFDLAESKTFAVPGIEGGELKTTLLRLERTAPIPGMPEEYAELDGLFAYWFVGHETVVPTHHERMITMAIDRVFGFKTHRWAYCFAQTLIMPGETEEDALSRMGEVIALTVPEFQEAGFPDRSSTAFAN